MSQDNQTLSNKAPKASRRAILTAAPAAAAAVLAGVATVNGLAAGLATPSSADPIFAVIAEHVAATKAYVASCHADTATTDDALMERSEDAWLAVVTTQPTTVPGVAALLAHVGRSEFLGEEENRSGDPETETVLSSWINGADPKREFSIAARTFESRLSEALRGIIERGRA